MNDHDAYPRVTPPDAPCGETVQAELRRLAAGYPAFRFRTQQGWDRGRLRWVAERIQGTDAGLHTVITTDLAELHAALEGDCLP